MQIVGDYSPDARAVIFSVRWLCLSLALLQLGWLAGCESFKPENRVRLGMSSKQVETLVGPVSWAAWYYQNADRSEEIEINFDGNYVKHSVRRETKGGSTLIEMQSDEGRSAVRYKISDKGGLILSSREVVASSNVQLPAYGDSRTEAKALLGIPSRATVNYVAVPLRGEYEADKLVRWNTEWPPPIVD